MLEWTFEFSKSAQLFDRIIISTESNEVYQLICKQKMKKQLSYFDSQELDSLLPIQKNIFVHKRSKKLSSPRSLTRDVIISSLEKMNLNDNDIIVLLQPTCPFRRIDTLDLMLNEFKSRKLSSLVSVSRIESPHPAKCFKIDADNRIKMKYFSKLSKPRQSLGNFFNVDGEFYIFDYQHLISNSTLITNDSRVFISNNLLNVNIDTNSDLNFARYLFRENRDLIIHSQSR